MALTRNDVVSLLPGLRRYARALTGSQEAGDGYVRALLEKIVREGAPMANGTPPRVALYTAFHKVWRPTSGPDEAGAARAEDPEARLGALSDKTRQSLLLVALEGFSFDDIGVILGITPAEARDFVVDAQAEIDKELNTDVLVIEDEAIIAFDIKELAEELGHHVTAISRTHAEAVQAARDHTPGLVLADIQLADQSSGIDAVRDITAEIDAPVIFVTAFPERLLTGERPEPTYLLTKPFDRLALKATIGQALFFHRKRKAS
jgi:CheY-like chemotaxis protein